MSTRRVRVIAIASLLGLATLGGAAADARAQGHSVVACRDRSGAIVQCASGGGGGGGMSDPTGGAAGAMAYQFGAMMGGAVRDMLVGNPDADAAIARQQAERAAAEARQKAEQVARQRAALQAEAQRSQAAAQRRQRQFTADQKDLVANMRDLDDAPTTQGSIGFNQRKTLAPKVDAAPAGTTASMGGSNALQQLQSMDDDLRDIGDDSPEALKAKAGGAFDQRQNAAPPVPKFAKSGAAGGGSGELQPRELDDAPTDSSVVDLRHARTQIVDPARMKSAASAAPRHPAPARPAVQPPMFDDLKYLLPDEPSLWPGPKHDEAPLINPLREPSRYFAYLTAEEKQLPQYRDQIEKIRSALDSDADRKTRFLEASRQLAREREAAIYDAYSEAERKIEVRLNGIALEVVGTPDRRALIERSRHDPALYARLQGATRDILIRQDRAIEAAREHEMGGLVQAFNRIYPDAALER